MSLLDGPSVHLSWKELACKDGTPYPEVFKVNGTGRKVAFMFESIRQLYGLPIVIFSSFRTPEHNKKIGGAKRSQHLLGKALDLQPPRGITIDQFYNDIKLNAEKFGIKGIGKYKTFVHVDVRDTSRLVVWTGNGIKDAGISV